MNPLGSTIRTVPETGIWRMYRPKLAARFGLAKTTSHFSFQAQRLGTPKARNSMGCCTSTTTLKHETKEGTSRSVLSESDAWDIAVAWRDQLRGCVRLETNTEALPSSFIPRFEWVTFVFNGPLYQAEDQGLVADPHQTAAYARAATIAWFALSCCDGYSGTENPRFWKRLMHTLLYPERMPMNQDEYPKRAQQPITDAVRFFDGEDAPFPRVRLVVGEADTTTATECVFLAKIPYKDETRDAKLRSILTKLRPFIRQARWTRQVPVQVDARQSRWTRNLYAEPLPQEVREQAKRSVAALFGDRTDAAPPETSSLVTVDFPQIQLQSVVVFFYTFSGWESLYSLLPRRGAVDVLVSGTMEHIAQDHRIWRALEPPSPGRQEPKASQPGWRVLQLTTRETDKSSFSPLSVLCSTLPHIKNIKSVKHENNRSMSCSFAVDWAWLGFAIFHPDAAYNSGFDSLELSLHAITPADITALTKMSVGNNLLGGNNTAYHEGLLRTSTTVWTEPDENGGSRLVESTAAMWVSLCLESDDKLKSQAWVCVVVPGFGHGWVRQADITETRPRPPGRSCLRTLVVTTWHDRVSKDLLIPLLAVVGGVLTSLHLKFTALLPKSMVEKILGLCPTLKIFRVCHDGSYWADPEITTQLPKLEELELTMKNGDQKLVPLQQLRPELLQHLKALRVISWGKENFNSNAHVLASILAKQPALQLLHWTNGSDLAGGQWPISPHDHEDDATSTFLQQLPPSSLRCQTPMQLKSKLTLQSATTTTLRDIYIHVTTPPVLHVPPSS